MVDTVFVILVSILVILIFGFVLISTSHARQRKRERLERQRVAKSAELLRKKVQSQNHSEPKKAIENTILMDLDHGHEIPDVIRSFVLLTEYELMEERKKQILNAIPKPPKASGLLANLMVLEGDPKEMAKKITGSTHC